MIILKGIVVISNEMQIYIKHGIYLNIGKFENFRLIYIKTSEMIKKRN